MTTELVLPIITDRQLPYVLFVGSIVGFSIGAGLAVGAVLAVDKMFRSFNRRPIEWEGIDE